MDRSALSASRRTIRRRLDKISRMVSECLQVREELVPGWVRMNRRRCGRPQQCRVCSRGERHENLSFGTRHNGQYLHRGIRPDKVEWLQAATERWHAFHKRRTALGKECQALLDVVDELKDLLCVGWQDAVWTSAPRRTLRRKES
jgi:hypothetical protein